jgi:membrane protein DedA with SNARE-associated domain
MFQWIRTLVHSLDYWGVGILMAVENVVLPLPSEVIMPVAGFESARGRMTLWGVVLAGSAGSAIGALPVYALARVIGDERLTSWLAKHGKWLLLRRSELERARKQFARHGSLAVFLAQLLPGVRGLIALPAGFARMNVWLFELLNFAGSLVWCVMLAWAGYLLRAHYPRVHRYVGPWSWTVWAALIVGVVIWSVRRRRRRVSRA